MMCNHCLAFSVCCCVIFIKLERYNEKITWVPCGGWSFFSKRSIRSQFSISLKSMVCNYFMNFLSAVVSQLSNLRTIMKTIDMGTLWCANFFQRLERNGFSPLKCVVCNHFVAFFLLRCVKITEFASYNKNGIFVHFGERSFCSLLVE